MFVIKIDCTHFSRLYAIETVISSHFDSHFVINAKILITDKNRSTPSTAGCCASHCNLL